MNLELLEVTKSIFSAVIGAGLTLAAVAKFGQVWFFRKIDSKHALSLAEKNNELMGDLERKKNELNRELQIEVAHFKAQLEVLGGQQSKFLEKKVDSILVLNQAHYFAVVTIKELTDVTNLWVDEVTSYFKGQLDDGDSDQLSSYGVYREMHRESWPSYQKKAEVALKTYAQCLSLNMPILPRALVEEEMAIVGKCKKILDDVFTNFSRAMNFSIYIVAPEEAEGTESEFMTRLIEERNNSIENKAYLDRLSSQLFDKSLRSGSLIESLLQPRTVA